MFLQRFSWAVLSLVLGLSLFGGCQSSRPVGPHQIISMKVSVPKSAGFSSSLLGAVQNEILYKVEGTDINPISGLVGPFTTSAPDGSYDFNVDIPTGGTRLLTVQLNDGISGEPLAVGAEELNLLNFVPEADIQVEMGSVTRNCYFMNAYSPTYAYGCTYDFNGDTLSGVTFGPTHDITFAYLGSPFPWYLQEAQNSPASSNHIAYLGNGNLVDHNFVPPDTSFFPDSMQAKGGPVSTLQIGDIYCVKLASQLGHAWIQITNTGSVGSRGPGFRFRTNTLHPFFAYDNTVADTSATCSANW